MVFINISPLHKRRNESSERLKGLAKVTQLKKWKSLIMNYQESFRAEFKCRLLLTGYMVLSKLLATLSFIVNW